MFVLFVLMVSGGYILQTGLRGTVGTGSSRIESSTVITGSTVCDDVDDIWCDQLGVCVDPWVRPCDTAYDAAVIQRMNAIRNATGEQFSYPVSNTLEWRGEVNNELTQEFLGGWTMELSDSGALEDIESALTGQGFMMDPNNVADGPGSGHWGYVLGSTVCILDFQSTEFYGPQDTVPERPISENKDIQVSCGRLP